MNKKLMKISATVLTAMFIIAFICTSAYAEFLDPSSITGTTISGKDDIKNVADKIVGALQVIGSAAAVIILMVLGFKYLMGSAEEKADYKKSMIPYIVGAIVIFLAPQIAGVIVKFFNS